MREFGPIKFILGTTPEEVAAAKPYLGIGRVQLGITKTLMQLGGLQQASRSITLPDGTLIHSQSVLGQDIVRIEAIPAVLPPMEATRISSRPIAVGKKKKEKIRQFITYDDPVAVAVLFGGQAYFQGAYADGASSGFGAGQQLTDMLFPGATFFGGTTFGRVAAGATSYTNAVLIAGATKAVYLIAPADGQILLFDGADHYTDVTATFLAGSGHPDPIIVSNQYATLVLGGDDGSGLVYGMMHDPSPIHSIRSTTDFTEIEIEVDDV